MMSTYAGLSATPQDHPQNLPDELIYRILGYLSPTEIVRLRLVSKRFNDITHDSQLWRAAYATAKLLRPPGPFSWQSARYLERTLVESERVSRTWTSQPLQIGSITRVSAFRQSILGDVILGCLLVCAEENRLVSLNLETNARQVIWENDQDIRSLEICSSQSHDGWRAFFILKSMGLLVPVFKVLVYSLVDQNNSLAFGPMTTRIDIPHEVPFYSPLWSPLSFALSDNHAMVVDKYTYSLFHLSHFDSGLLEPAERERSHLVKILLTGRYIITFLDTPKGRLIQIYTAGTNSRSEASGTSEPRLTHENLGLFNGSPRSLNHVIRDPVVDPLTGDTTLRFLGTSVQQSITYFACVTFILPPSHPNSQEIASFSPHIQQLFVIPEVARHVKLEASSDGYVRGLIVCNRQFEHLAALYKFSIDASGDVCTSTVSEVVTSARPGWFNLRVFDGVRGRVCDDKTSDGRMLYVIALSSR